MRSELHQFPRENGEIQRISILHLDNWEQLELLRPQPSDKALDCFHLIYDLYLIPSAPHLFGTVVMFSLPEDVTLPFSSRHPVFGHLADPLAVAAAAFRDGLFLEEGQIRFRTPQIRSFWNTLQQRGCIRTIRGGLPHINVIPVGNECGFLTESCPDAAAKVNGAFFIMDPIDCSTPYDHIGAWFGLFVRDGIVESPPLFHREALLVKRSGEVSIQQPDIRNLAVQVGGHTFIHGQNAHFYTRPEQAFTPAGTQALVITGRKLTAVCEDSAAIPCSGFAVCPVTPVCIAPGSQVTYTGMEDIGFGIQVGNSILKDGQKTTVFHSPFYDLRDPAAVPFPPSMYPLDFTRARAARIALGSDAQGKPVLLWAEGAAKLGHTPGQDSCGASLTEMADICAALGLHNAVNLDGGGSAQLLLHNRRSLQLSDRNQQDRTESQRPVPMGLMVRI